MIARPSVAHKAKKLSRPARAPAARPDSVIDGLRRQYDELTQSQKRIAEYIVANPHAVAFATVDQMAAELGINPSTIVRFTYRLGLKGFPDLQERTRQLVRGQLSAATEVVDENSFLAHLEGTIYGSSLEQDLQNIRRAISGLSIKDLDRASHMIVSARRVYVAGAFAAHSVALYLALALNRIRGETTLWGGELGIASSQSLDVQPNDCLVAFSSAPYAVVTQRLVQVAKKAGAKLIAVTDTPISAIGQLADVVLSAPSAGAGPQNSFVASMVIANALLNGAAGLNGQRTLERYARFNALANEWDTFLLKGDDGQ
jgi:DNA-binding MurR/RpiR family transcriptional regulator